VAADFSYLLAEVAGDTACLLAATRAAYEAHLPAHLEMVTWWAQHVLEGIQVNFRLGAKGVGVHTAYHVAGGTVVLL
jgi:hypothetical protein